MQTHDSSKRWCMLEPATEKFMSSELPKSDVCDWAYRISSIIDSSAAIPWLDVINNIIRGFRNINTGCQRTLTITFCRTYDHRGLVAVTRTVL